MWLNTNNLTSLCQLMYSRCLFKSSVSSQRQTNQLTHPRKSKDLGTGAKQPSVHGTGTGRRSSVIPENIHWLRSKAFPSAVIHTVPCWHAGHGHPAALAVPSSNVRERRRETGQVPWDKDDFQVKFRATARPSNFSVR